MDVILIVGQFDVVPFGVVEGLAHFDYIIAVVYYVSREIKRGTVLG